MIFKRYNAIKEMPCNCLECPLSPHKRVNECDLPLDDSGYWLSEYDSVRHELCPLVELDLQDIDIILHYANKNREDSEYLANYPTQKWKELHKSEVIIMKKLIERFETVKASIINMISFTEND